MAVPGPEPDHRRALRGDGRRRGARAERRADHGRFRARGGTRGAGRAGRDHVRAVGRHERAAAARRDAGDVRRPTCSRRSGSSRAAAESRTRARRPAARRSLGSPTARHGADELVRTTGLAPGEVAAALAELELAGAVVSRADGGLPARAYDRAVTPYWLDEPRARAAAGRARGAVDVVVVGGGVTGCSCALASPRPGCACGCTRRGRSRAERAGATAASPCVAARRRTTWPRGDRRASRRGCALAADRACDRPDGAARG